MTPPLSTDDWMRLGALLMECVSMRSRTENRAALTSRLRALPSQHVHALEAYLTDVADKLQLRREVAAAVLEMMPLDHHELERIHRLVEHDFRAMELADRISG